MNQRTTLIQTPFRLGAGLKIDHTKETRPHSKLAAPKCNLLQVLILQHFPLLVRIGTDICFHDHFTSQRKHMHLVTMEHPY